MNCDKNFTNEGKSILKKSASDARMINYNNLFFKADDPIIKDCDFFKRFGTLNDLLIHLLNEEISTNKAVKEQNEMIIKIEELKDFTCYKENKDKNTGKTLFCRTKKYFKKCIKTVW